MSKNIINYGKGILFHLKKSIPKAKKDEIEQTKPIDKYDIKPEDVIVLIDGSRSRRLIPKAIIDDYDKNGNKLDFKSTYSIKGIIVEAYDVNDAIKQYKEIKSNLLED